jgi:hypothetical protein
MAIMAAGAVTLAVCGGFSLAYALQRKFIYYPTRKMMFSPEDYQLDYEDIRIDTKDKVKLHAWFIKDKNYDTVPTILFFHGNSGSISVSVLRIGL